MRDSRCPRIIHMYMHIHLASYILHVASLAVVGRVIVMSPIVAVMQRRVREKSYIYMYNLKRVLQHSSGQWIMLVYTL